MLVDPVLGPEGFITDKEARGEKLFMRYVLSHHSQGTHYGRHYSLGYDIAQAGDNMETLVSAVKDSLVSLFSDEFTRTEIEVAYREDEKTLVIYMLFDGHILHRGVQLSENARRLVQYTSEGTIKESTL
jgi:hypothetical protein